MKHYRNPFLNLTDEEYLEMLRIRDRRERWLSGLGWFLVFVAILLAVIGESLLVAWS